MTNNRYGLNLRLVAYTPGGDKMGELPEPTAFSISRVRSGAPSLTINYSAYANRSEWLDDDLEVAVEWNDGFGWREDSDSRFFFYESDRDEVEATQSITYTLPGLVSLLSTASVVTTISNSPDNISRKFNDATPGGVLKVLLNEAIARSCFNGLITFSFNENVDSAGDDWNAERQSYSFPRGMYLWDILDSWVRSGIVDFRMVGRQLQVFNPRNELAVPRANRKRVRTTTDINPTTFINSVESVSSTGPAARFRDKTERSRFTSNVVALATDGEPRFTYDLRHDFLSGRWQSTPSREVATYRMLSEGEGGLDVDGTINPFGYWIADVNEAIRYVLVVPDPSDEQLRSLAAGVLARRGGGLVVVNQCTLGDYNWFRDRQNALALGLVPFADRGVPIYEIGRFTVDYKTSGGASAVCLIQTGAAKSTKCVTRLNTLLNADSITNIMDVNDAHALGLASVNDRAPGERAKLNVVSSFCRNRNSPWTRLTVRGTWLNSTPNRERIEDALVAAIALNNTPKMPRVNAKPTTDPEFTNDLDGAVELRYGRDVLEAPVKRSLSERAGRVYGYGDAFARVTAENLDAPSSFGVWERVVTQGGVGEETMLDMVYETLDRGSNDRVEVTRGVTFGNARYLPFRDYDHGDIVLCQTGTHETSPYRIEQMVVERQQGGEMRGSLTMGVAYESASDRATRAVLSSTGISGSTRVGGSGAVALPPVAKTAKPAKPSWS